MALQYFGPMLHDVAQRDEAALSNARVLLGKALPHMLSDPLKVGLSRLSHGITNSGLHSVEGVGGLASSRDYLHDSRARSDLLQPYRFLKAFVSGVLKETVLKETFDFHKIATESRRQKF